MSASPVAYESLSSDGSCDQPPSLRCSANSSRAAVPSFSVLASAHASPSSRKARSSVTSPFADASQSRARPMAVVNSARFAFGAYNCSARMDTAVTSMSFDSIGGRRVANGQRPSAACRRRSHTA